MAELKQLARRIFHDTLAAIDIPAAMQRKLWRDGTVLHCGDELVVELSGYSRVFAVAIGKAAHAMVEGVAPVGGGMGVRRWWRGSAALMREWHLVGLFAGRRRLRKWLMGCDILWAGIRFRMRRVCKRGARFWRNCGVATS